jgi:hypothetical protein
MQQVLTPLLADGLVKIIILDKHRTGLQKYELIGMKKAMLESAKPEGEMS